MLLHRSKIFLACKIIKFTLYPLKGMLDTLGVSQVVNKRKPTEACRNDDRSSKPHYSLEALMSPNTTEAFTAKIFF